MYVSICALVLLILILVVVGVAMSQLQSLVPFPPTQNACPVYWDVSSNPTNCGIPVNTNAKNTGYIAFNTGSSKGTDVTKNENIGMCKSAPATKFGCGDANKLSELTTVDGTSKYQYVKLNDNTQWGKLYPGLKERCAQKKWANMMNIEWDGVSNYNGC